MAGLRKLQDLVCNRIPEPILKCLAHSRSMGQAGVFARINFYGVVPIIQGQALERDRPQFRSFDIHRGRVASHRGRSKQQRHDDREQRKCLVPPREKPCGLTPELTRAAKRHRVE